MATELLAAGANPAVSADAVLDAGQAISLKNHRSAPRVLVELKSDGSSYTTVDELTDVKPAVVLGAAGTYRFRRLDGYCGVFSG